MELMYRFTPTPGAFEFVDITFPSDRVKGIELKKDMLCGEQKTVEKLLTDNFTLFRISPSIVEYPGAENVLIPI
jgi:hypothetical protein